MKQYVWTEEQKKALRGSIKKWEKIVNGTGIDEGVDNCPCCKIFLSGMKCTGCPVLELSGMPGCKGTPYGAYASEQKHDRSMAELNFLRAVYLAGGGK